MLVLQAVSKELSPLRPVPLSLQNNSVFVVHGFYLTHFAFFAHKALLDGDFQRISICSVHLLAEVAQQSHLLVLPAGKAACDVRYSICQLIVAQVSSHAAQFWLRL